MEAGRLEQYLEFRPAWHSFAVYMLGAVIFFFGPMVNPEAPISPALSDLLATCFLAFIIIKRFTSLYSVMGGEVTALSSFPKQKKQSAEISEINRIDLRRGLTQRMLGVAHVHLYVRGNEDPAVKLFGVPQPDEFRRALLDLGASDQRVTGAWRK